MRILIVGQGAIGSMLGARLKLKGNEVFFVVRNPLRVGILEREGIVLFEKEHRSVVKCDGIYQFSRLEHPLDVDYVIIATKSYDAKDVAEKMKDMVPDSAKFITLQNGIIPHIEVSKIVGEKRHIILSLYDSAFSFSLNQVRLTGRGENILTSFDPTVDLKDIEGIFKRAGFNVKIEKDAFSVLYRKLFINAVINSITAVLRIKNGELVTNKYANDLAVGVIYEIREISSKLHLKDKDTIDETIFSTASKTKDNRSSMLQDIEWKRKTEVEDILGYTLNLAKEYHVEVPKLETLYLMVKTLESQYLK